MDWIRYRIEDAKANRSPVLDLSLPYWVDAPGDRLTALPPDVLEMDWLEELDLSGHALTALPPEICALSRLSRLNLSGNYDIRLRDELAEMPALVALSLKGLREDAIVAVPWSSLTGLQDLALSSMIEGVPPALAGLPNLRMLDLGGTAGPAWLRDSQLESLSCALSTQQLQNGVLPPSLRKLYLILRGVGGAFGLTSLENLRALSVLFEEPGDVKLSDALIELPDLASLNIYGVLGRGILLRNPTILARLPSLRSLGLRRVAVDLDDLTPLWSKPLEQIALSDIPLHHIPSDICRNPALRSLTLSRTRLTEFPAALFERSDLTALDLSFNKFLPLLRAIGHLTGLTKLRLAGCGLTALPDELGALSALQSLQLYRNPLTALPSSLSRLTALEQLDLRRSNITHLPVGLTSLRRLKPVGLPDGLAEPPPEIVAQGWAAIQQYTADLARESVVAGEESRLYEAKLIIVGEGDVGKTCLARRLKDSDACLADVKTTEGVVIKPWSLRTAKSHDFRVNIWDFGGQEIYRATHQFFLTERSLYLLVWDARREDRAGGFEYWLDVIRVLGGSGPVLVVLNKCDERTELLPERDLMARFPNIVGFLRVSAHRGDGMDALREAIREAIDGLKHVGTPWPPSWTRVRRRLEADPRDTMERGEYLNICGEEGIEPATADTLAGFLHDLGVILHFRDDPQLRHLVILKPEWGTDAVYQVLDTGRIKAQNGRFGPADLAEIWNDSRHPRATHPDLLRLMSNFELSFPVADTEDHIATGLLPKDSPQEPWDEATALLFEYRYDFMPAGIITRFICRIHTLIDRDLYWRNGVFLAHEGHRARIEGDEKRVRIAIQGPQPQELLAVIRAEFGHIHHSLNKLSPQQMLPCRCSHCRDSAKPYFFDYAAIKNLRGKRDTVPCLSQTGSGEDVRIADLLGILGNEFWLDLRKETDMPSEPQAKPLKPAVKKPEPERPLTLPAAVVIVLVVLGAVAALVHFIGVGEVLTAIGVSVPLIIVAAAIYFFDEGRIKEAGLLKMLRMGTQAAASAQGKARGGS